MADAGEGERQRTGDGVGNGGRWNVAGGPVGRPRCFWAQMGGRETGCGEGWLPWGNWRMVARMQLVEGWLRFVVFLVP